MVINKYFEPRKVLDKTKRFESKNLLEIQIPKEAVLQFFRKRLMESREKWYKIKMVNFKYDRKTGYSLLEEFKIPKDAIFLDYIINENNISLILEHKSFSETPEGSFIERQRIFLE